MAETTTQRWNIMLENACIDVNEQNIFNCNDRRQNGTCRCIERCVMGDQEPVARLNELLNYAREADRLKIDKCSTASGRRYSSEYWNFVMANRQKLSQLRLCKKSVVRLLRCSLNFLYRDTACRERERKKIKPIDELLRTKCCDRMCINVAWEQHQEDFYMWREKIEHGKCKDKREVFYDMKEHALSPCENAIRELTQLSKATINNLRTKPRTTGIKHSLEGRKRSSTSSISSTSTLTPNPLTPVTPFTPGERTHFPLPPSYMTSALSERKHFKIPKIEVESEDYKIRENGITATKPEVGAIRYPPASSVIFSESFPHSPLLSPGLQAGYHYLSPLPSSLFSSPTAFTAGTISPTSPFNYENPIIYDLPRQRCRLQALTEPDDDTIRSEKSPSPSSTCDPISEDQKNAPIFEAKVKADNLPSPKNMLELTKVAKKRKKMPELMPIRPNVVVKSPDLLKIENDLSHKSVETPTITAVTPNRLRPTSSFFNFPPNGIYPIILQDKTDAKISPDFKDVQQSG